jgi:hypothetical protein
MISSKAFANLVYAVRRGVLAFIFVRAFLLSDNKNSSEFIVEDDNSCFSLPA